MMKKPIIGITMGDPASIGPELSVRALADPALYEECSPVIIGDITMLERAMRIPGMPQLKIRRVQQVSECLFEPGTMDVLDMGLCSEETVPVGQISVTAGDAAFQYVKKVIELALAGDVDATVTNALNKEAMNLAGHHFAGHTEIYAHYTNTDHYTMMLAHDNIRIVHVSTHISLREACDRCKKARVLECIRIADQACKDMGIVQPRVAVAGLNPHCGEGGLFGR